MSRQALEDIHAGVMESLKPFNSAVMPVTPSSVRRLHSSDLRYLMHYLKEGSPKKDQASFDRPVCPRFFSQARIPYKNSMINYVAQYGFVCQNPVAYTPSILEAIANYLEHRSKNGSGRKSRN